MQKTQLDEAINELGDDPTDGKFDFVSFCSVASKFLIEEDVEQMREELKEAFRYKDILHLGIFFPGEKIN